MAKLYSLWMPAFIISSVLVMIGSEPDMPHKFQATGRVSQTAEADPTKLYLTMHLADDVPKSEEELAARYVGDLLTERDEIYLAGRFDSDLLTERDEIYLAGRFDSGLLTELEEQQFLETRHGW